MKHLPTVAILGTILVAGIYSAHGKDWQDKREACKKYKHWVASENKSPKTPTPYEKREFWEEFASENKCKTIDIVKYSDTQPKKGTPWPEYLKSLQEETYGDKK